MSGRCRLVRFCRCRCCRHRCAHSRQRRTGCAPIHSVPLTRPPPLPPARQLESRSNWLPCGHLLQIRADLAAACRRVRTGGLLAADFFCFFLQLQRQMFRRHLQEGRGLLAGWLADRPARLAKLTACDWPLGKQPRDCFLKTNNKTRAPLLLPSWRPKQVAANPAKSSFF